MTDGTGPKPLRKQRSEWKPVSPDSPAWERHVRDGRLVAIVAREAGLYHLSISHRDHRNHLTRYPSWDEITDARSRFLPPERWFAMYLPPDGDYVANHPTTFQLWECPEPEVQ